ncbi:hypothetical protein [Nocardia yamanashiensis]|uniref:hypothetical protein n=1 Tax=Nocardia yamanashiensis TaxID=209247 RepID=UPI000836DF40|nr:hypothetical protein [Nocardia yamanashiensis]
MPHDDPTGIELQVIQDVLDTVETRIRAAEQCGLRLTVPRSRVYAAVLLAVIVSARETHRIPATLDHAAILDEILDGAEPFGTPGANQPVEQVIRNHATPVN